MTCREFKHSAEALSLWELSRAHDAEILIHAQQCESCGSWLREQRSLAASLQTLQARTAGLEAGANVERAVLRAFRQHSAQGGAVSIAPSTAASTAAPDALPDGVEERIAPWPTATPVSSTPVRAQAARTGDSVTAPLVMRLSRWFEIGAYAAVAAAVIVGMSLGIRLLEHRSTATPVQATTAPAIVQPVVQKPVAVAPAASPKLAAANPSRRATSAPVAASRAIAEQKNAISARPSAATEESPTYNDAGYTALMFCDPLSCAADSQVVRMELPAQSGQGMQSADLVVGYDGIVRAVRMVN